MRILLALLVTVFAVKPLSIGDFLTHPISDHARQLRGQAIVDYVNSHQSLYKAKFSPDAEEFTMSRIMDLKYLSHADETVTEEELDLSDEKIPERFDARQKWPQCDSIGFIRDQSKCGSCWAVTAAEVMSDRLCIRSNGTKKAHISDTDVLTCCGNECGNGCNGGWKHKAFEYAISTGVCKPYPFYPCGQYENQTVYGPCPKKLWGTPRCRKTCQLKYPVPYEKDKIHAERSYRLPNNETIIKREIMTNGPVAASFEVHADFSFYKEGIYKNKVFWPTGIHAVKIIGWGTENGTDYWLIANSWSTYWGENGYFRILRGVNHCDIEHSVAAVTMAV